LFRRELGNSSISGLYIKHPTAGKCILVNYSEDVYRQRFTVAHETAHAILDDEQDFVVSFTWDKKNLVEIRANAFASGFLLPPTLLRQIPDPNSWTEEKVIDWANRFGVSTTALAYALKKEKLVSNQVEAYIRAIKVPAHMKTDPELPEDLSSGSRTRREGSLKRGLSTFYVDLCFDAYEQKIISAGRLAEILLISVNELSEMAEVYGRQLRYAD
jgi:Zn-dependent peptidase ImmA (M78 family)